MPAPSSFNDYGPITWFRRTPIYVTTILVALLVVAMFATTFLATARVSWLVFAFSPTLFWEHGALWQILTYPFLEQPSFFFIFSLFFLYWFGVDVERYLGRSRYLTLLGLLVLTSPLIQTVWWKLSMGGLCFGSTDLTIGFFVAFATLYPNLEYWGWITMKWLAFAGILLSSMNYLPEQNWPGLSSLLGTCAVSFGYVRFLQGGGSITVPGVIANLFRRRPRFKIVRASSSDGGGLHESIDPLLDKISKHGISSLTSRERAQLERARESLLKKTD